jgi:hypothetical protein
VAVPRETGAFSWAAPFSVPRYNDADREATPGSSAHFANLADSSAPFRDKLRVRRSWSLSNGRASLHAFDATEPDVARRSVDGLRKSRRWPIPETVVLGAQERPALQHLPREPGRGIEAHFPQEARVLTQAAVVARVPSNVEVRRPFPNIADRLMKTEAVRWKGVDGGGALEAIDREVFPGELALPVVRHRPAVRSSPQANSAP